VRDSKLPPAHQAEIDHPYYEMPVVIDLPPHLRAKLRVGDGPGYTDPYMIQVNNGKSTEVKDPWNHRPVWLRRRHNVIVVTYPDAE
jgi:hypothetical protein